MSVGQVQVDVIANGAASGAVAERLMEHGMDVALLRPYYETEGPMRGRKLVANSQGRVLTANAATLRKDEWAMFDNVVIKAARERLNAWNDLGTLSGTFGGFNGMASMVLEHETMSDPGEAQVSFDGLVQGPNDAPEFQLEGLPLPITHVDFFFSSRRLAISRKMGTPIDSSMAEAAGRRVAEAVEKTTIGSQVGAILDPKNATSIYGRSVKVFGYTNFPDRLVKDDFSDPSDNGWDPAATLDDVLDAVESLRENKFYGPFMLYHSPAWSRYLDADYYRLESSGAVAPTKTLRNRLREIEDIRDVKRLDLFTDTTNPFQFIFVQMTTDVARAVNGMNMTTVQWETVGGMRLNFKVMCIHVPQLRSDHYGNCGLLHGKV
jgi:hypothetical protein